MKARLLLPEYEETQRELRAALCVLFGPSLRMRALATLQRLLQEPDAAPLSVEFTIETTIEEWMQEQNREGIAHRKPFGDGLREAYEALRCRPPETVKAVLDEELAEAAEVERAVEALRSLEGRIRDMVKNLDDRTRCLLVALAKLADSDLPVEYGMELYNDFSFVNGKRLARDMARAFGDDPQVQDLLTAIRCVDRISENGP